MHSSFLALLYIHSKPVPYESDITVKWFTDSYFQHKLTLERLNIEGSSYPQSADPFNCTIRFKVSVATVTPSFYTPALPL